MNVRIVVLAAGAYACIEDDGRTMDVALAAGKSAIASLRESVEDTRQRAQRLLSQADFMERAADELVYQAGAK